MITARRTNNRRSYNRVARDTTVDSINQTTVNKIPRYISLPGGPGGEPGMEGNIVLDRSTRLFCYHNGLTWVCIGGPTTDQLLNACSTGVSLVIDGSGPDFSIAGLLAGTGIALASGPCVTISTVSNLTNACSTGVSLVIDGSGPDFSIAGLLAGTGIALASGPCVTISTVSNLTNACSTGINLVVDGSGPDFSIAGLLAGTAINISSDGSCVTISSTGDNISLSNTCSTGISLVVDGSGPNLSIAGLLAGTGITLGTGPCVTINSFVNLVDNCPNVGNISKSIVLDGSGPDLLVRGLRAATGILLLNDSSCIIIMATGAAQPFSIEAPCDTGLSLLIDGTGPIFKIKNLVAGTAINLSDDGSCITVSSTGNNVMLLDACPATSPPSGVSLVVDGSGPDLAIAGLRSGTGIELTSDGSCVTISADASSLNTNISLENACPSGISLVVDGSGPDLIIAGLLAGTGIDLSTDGSCVTISADASSLNTNVTLSTGGTCDCDLVLVGTGPNLIIRGLEAGENITLTEVGSCCRIDAEDDDINLESTGSGVSLVADGCGPLLAIFSLTTGPGIQISSTASGVRISAPEAATTTLANLCSNSTGNLVVDGTGPSLSIKGLEEGTGISLSSDLSCVTISINKTSGNLSLYNFPTLGGDNNGGTAFVEIESTSSTEILRFIYRGSIIDPVDTCKVSIGSDTSSTSALDFQLIDLTTTGTGTAIIFAGTALEAPASDASSIASLTLIGTVPASESQLSLVGNHVSGAPDGRIYAFMLE